MCTNSKEDLRSESKDGRKLSEGTVAVMGLRKVLNSTRQCISMIVLL